MNALLTVGAKGEVLGLPAIFHQWIKNTDREAYGLIEYISGRMDVVPYKNINFTDAADFLKKIEEANTNDTTGTN